MSEHEAIKGIDNLKPGDHLCQIYATEQEHRDLLTPFILKGLRQNDKVLYIVDSHTAEEILDYLKKTGIDPKKYIDSGQFVILTRDDTYMKQGFFEPDFMINLLRAEIDKATKEGYSALRVTGEMTWALRNLPGSEKLIEYEAKLNELFPGSRALVICQYDKRRFDAEVLLNVLRTHPFAVIGTEVYDNPFYLPPKEFLSQDPLRATLEHWLKNLAERKKTEEELRLHSEIVKNMVEAVYLVGADDGIIKYCNPKFENMFGYDPGEMVGRHVSIVNASTDKDPKETAKEIMGSLNKSGEWHGEVRNIRKDGTTFWCYASCSVFQHPAYGRVVISVHSDITERKKMENMLRESAVVYKALIETTSTGYVIIDKEGKVLDANAEYVRLTGHRDLNEIRGKSVTEWTADYEKEKNAEAVAKCAKDGYIRNLEIDYVDKHGKITSIEINATVVLREGIPQILTLCRDITERKKAEEKIERSSAEWQGTFDSISDLIFLQDKDFTITRVNKAFSDALKAKPEDIVGKKCYELLHKRDTPWPECPFEKTKHDGKANVQEVDDPGIGIPLLVTTSPIFNEKGELIGSVHIAKNISEIKKARQELELKVRDLERFQKVTMGRENRIIELKEEVKRLRSELEKGGKA